MLYNAARIMVLIATLKPCLALIEKVLSTWVLFSSGLENNRWALWSSCKEQWAWEPDCLDLYPGSTRTQLFAEHLTQ